MPVPNLTFQLVTLVILYTLCHLLYQILHAPSTQKFISNIHIPTCFFIITLKKNLMHNTAFISILIDDCKFLNV